MLGDGNDFVRGNSEDNMIFGMRGNDRLFGFAGNDTLDAGAGTGLQIVSGGLGDDTYLYSREDALVGVDNRNNGEIAGPTGGDDIVIFDDLLRSDFTIIYAEFRNSQEVGYTLNMFWSIGGESGRFIAGDAGRNIETFQFSDGETVDWDTLLSDYHMIGDGTNETIQGNALDNLIEGGAGVDILHGGAGGDILDVGTGNGVDIQLMGGEGGNDTYVYNTADGIAGIDSRFEGATDGTNDRIIFEDLLFSDISAALITDTRTDAGGNTLELSWTVNGGGSFLIGADGQFIENYEFSDGSVFNVGDFTV